MNLKGKTVLITGASSGIGFELASQLFDHECNLILLARRKELLDDFALKKSRNSIQKIYTYKCDVSSREEVEKTFSEIIKENSDINIAILNAGIDKREAISESDSATAEKILGVNLLGLIYCTEQLISFFRKKNGGIIAGVSSLADVRGFPKSGFYCASKAAVSTFLESIRVELAKENIKVITIKPGFVKTPMTSTNKFYMPFLLQVEKAAAIIIKGIKKEKKIIQFPLRLVILAKLIKILPNFIFDYLSARKKNL